MIDWLPKAEPGPPHLHGVTFIGPDDPMPQATCPKCYYMRTSAFFGVDRTLTSKFYDHSGASTRQAIEDLTKRTMENIGLAAVPRIAVPKTCGHPGPHGYGGLCFDCHKRKDVQDRWGTENLHGPLDSIPDGLKHAPPTIQAHSLGAGMIGTWATRHPGDHPRGCLCPVCRARLARLYPEADLDADIGDA